MHRARAPDCYEPPRTAAEWAEAIEGVLGREGPGGEPGELVTLQMPRRDARKLVNLLRGVDDG